MSDPAEQETVQQLLDLSRRLLDSIHAQDWEAYAALCDPSLTCFEPEAVGNLVAGMPFHRFYFEMEASNRPHQSTISSPDVRLMGDTAVVCYIRLTQRIEPDGHPITKATEETRIWQKQNGQWRHVHFHRSPA